MATQIVQAPTSAERTAPLSPNAITAMRRLELHFVATRVADAVRQYESAAQYAVRLGDKAATGTMTDLEADSLVQVWDLMVEAYTVLSDADQLHLLEMAA